MKKDWLLTIITILPGILLAAYILTRIFTVSMTIDEPKTCLLYARYDVVSIMSNLNPDPNNHIFHTLLVKLFAGIFGLHQWSVRLPNLIGFVLFYTSGVALFKKLTANKWLLLAAILLFFTNPYLLDFFGLARGYGLSIGLLLTSIYFTVRFIEKNKSSFLTASLSFGILATYTQFPLLNYFLALLCFLGFYFLFIQKQSLRNWFIPVAATLILGALLYLPLKQLITHNAVPVWGTNNFIKDTAYSLLISLRYNHSIAFITSLQTLFILLLVGIGGGIAGLFFFRNRLSPLQYYALLFFSIALLLPVLFMVLQNKLLGTAYLLTRTALFLWPLCLLFIIATLLLIAPGHKWSMALLVLICIAGLNHFLRCANFTKTFEWTFNSSEKKVIRYLEKVHNRTQAPISLNCHWNFYPSLDFYKESFGLDWLEILPYHENTHTNNAAEYYFTYTTEAPLINSCYTPVEPFDKNNQLLFKCRR